MYKYWYQNNLTISVNLRCNFKTEILNYCGYFETVDFKGRESLRVPQSRDQHKTSILGYFCRLSLSLPILPYFAFAPCEMTLMSKIKTFRCSLQRVCAGLTKFLPGVNYILWYITVILPGQWAAWDLGKHIQNQKPNRVSWTDKVMDQLESEITITTIRELYDCLNEINWTRNSYFGKQ